MDKPLISIVFGYRNRELDRVKRCLDSLAQQTVKNFEVLFVDYGSDKNYAIKAEDLVSNYSFVRYIFTEARGHLWSRGKALNIGIKEAKGEWVFTNDLDMILPSNLLEKMSRHLADKSFYHLLSNNLTASFDRWNDIDEIPLQEYNEGGRGILLIPRNELIMIGGYDEFYHQWGVEDLDLYERLISHGLEEKPFPNDVYQHHQWHPVSHITLPAFIPIVFEAKMQIYFHERKKVIVRNPSGWGEVLSQKDRPIISFLESGNFSGQQISINRENLGFFFQTEMVKLLFENSSLLLFNDVCHFELSLYSKIKKLIRKFLLKVQPLRFQQAEVDIYAQVLYELILSHKTKDYFIDSHNFSTRILILS